MQSFCMQTTKTDQMDVQTDLCLSLDHMSERTFSHIAAHTYIVISGPSCSKLTMLLANASLKL